MEADHKDPPYIMIWVILLVLTLGELFYAFLDMPKIWLAVGLIAMAVWKAVLVALYYMHLKFEPKRMWVLAVIPIPLAAILVLVVMQEF
jgi:cytochrome c oxidase subunit 4